MTGGRLAREPRFGERLAGIYASEDNPHKYGMYVRTIRRSGRMNPGKFYELTDGRGNFWQYPAESVVRADESAGEAPVTSLYEPASERVRCPWCWSSGPNPCESMMEAAYCTRTVSDSGDRVSMCERFVEVGTDPWAGTYCKLLAGHAGPCSSLYPDEIPAPVHREEGKADG